MFEVEKLTFKEFLYGLKSFNIIPHFRLRRSQSGEISEQDWVTRNPNRGAHIGRCCTC
ncbi:hypothetical protein [Facklamia sp. P13055]|uniref:hypothetical protein n=1 Tax=unclassified Facklamia TaxID=2622293 RepID=UPI003D186D4F